MKANGERQAIKLKIKDITKQAIIGAVYLVLTTVLAPISFGAVQVRVSEALCLLVAYDPLYLIGIVLGTVLANMQSPLGFIDVFVGGGASFLCLGVAVLINKKLKTLTARKVVVITSMIVAMIFVALELKVIYGLPLIYTYFVISAGELVSLLFGCVLFGILEKKIDLERH